MPMRYCSKQQLYSDIESKLVPTMNMRLSKKNLKGKEHDSSISYKNKKERKSFYSVYDVLTIYKYTRAVVNILLSSKSKQPADSSVLKNIC